MGHFAHHSLRYYAPKSYLSPVVAKVLTQSGKAKTAPSTVYKISVTDHIEQLIREAGEAGIDLRLIVDRVYSGRKPVANPRGSAQTAISLLRRRGINIFNTGSVYRIGAPLVLKASPSLRSMQRPRTRNQPLGPRELAVVRVLREFSNNGADDIWLTASDIADEIGVSRENKETNPRNVAAMIRNIVAKGFDIESKNAGLGTAALAYKLKPRIKG